MKKTTSKKKKTQTKQQQKIDVILKSLLNLETVVRQLIERIDQIKPCCNRYYSKSDRDQWIPQGPLEQIIRGTVRLHELIEQGLGESEEADLMRDKMDAPFLALNESEREAAQLVSAAMYSRNRCSSHKDRAEKLYEKP
jgi:hypothetical protein